MRAETGRAHLDGTEALFGRDAEEGAEKARKNVVPRHARVLAACFCVCAVHNARCQAARRNREDVGSPAPRRLLVQGQIEMGAGRRQHAAVSLLPVPRRNRDVRGARSARFVQVDSCFITR